MVRIWSLLIGYAFGLFQTAYFYGKLKGIDIRNYGSGNAGTTNMLRTLGTKSGLIVLLGDVLKTIIAINVVTLLFRGSHTEMIYLLKMYATIGCIIGHNYPLYMHFHGGKGVAVTGGFLLAFKWEFIPVGLATFFFPFLTTHFVSLGSLCMVTGFYIQLIVEGQMGVFGAPQAILIEMYILGAFITGLCWLQHRKNLSRLAHGNERKTYLGKKNHASLSGDDLKKMKEEHEHGTEHGGK
ncbi:MAG: glycerol-3-phosphate acyltransferase [Lachnospiraceae bacterium]|nr:glycerol-3-phosphate acyltransferase [Lachnospiraceae bacterium]MDD4524570.1 glycerol-3-phosphate acyltransferase [Lachnospiraceae bacterium]